MTIAAITVALVIVAVIVAVLARRKGSPALQGAASKAPSALGPSPTRPAVVPSSGTAAPGGAVSAPAPAGAPESLAPSALVFDHSVSVAPPAGEARSARDISSLRKGLAATRGGFIARLSALFRQKSELDSSTLQQLEEIMLAGDVGPKTTQAILLRLRDALGRADLRNPDAIAAALRAEARRILTVPGGGGIRLSSKPTVVLMVGVNGVGKTTTIGKLATRYGANNKKVVLAAGDTFRAAAVQQLEVWGKRVGAEVVRGKEGADPGSVAFDATTRATAAGADLLLVDTAGRLHTKAPLMDEIKKVRKTIAKALDGAPHETLLVLDATTGQNGLQQATMFREALDLTGVVLTKLDGTAKGGVVLAISDELRIPVRYVGLGERAEDLREFHADEFVEALFGPDDGPGAQGDGPIAATS
jgi:fused signal recognition particle receptor